MGDVFSNAKKRGLPVHAVTSGLDKKLLLEDESHPGDPDPHVWMDVEVWSATLEEIVRVLCEVDPDGCMVYRQNAKAYQQHMVELDEKVGVMVGTIPSEQRVLVTAHDAFRYFGRAYGIEVHGIQGISTDSEAGLSDLNELVNFLVVKKIPAVFIESSVSPRNVQALIEGAKAQGHDVVVGGELYSDAMGPAGTPTGTYRGMMEHNALVITRALGGVVVVPASSSPEKDEDLEES
jgi:manganese/zinc/iron transport system substrate-binding protein